MNIENLIKLANRIGDFFVAMPDRDEGIEGVAHHIEKFWEPRMRQALLDFVAEHPDGAAPDAALNEITLQALSRNHKRLTPRQPA